MRTNYTHRHSEPKKFAVTFLVRRSSSYVQPVTWNLRPITNMALLLLAMCVWNGIAQPSEAEAQDRSKVVRLLHEARDFRMRVRAVFILADAADLQYSSELEAALRDPHPAVRVAAAAALGRIQSTRALPALRMARADRSPEVRAQASRSVDMIELSTRRNATAALVPVTSTVAVELPKPTWPRVQRVVIMGEMRSSASYQDRRMTEVLRNEALAQLSNLEDTVVVTEGSPLSDVTKRQIRARKIPVLRLDGHLQGFRRRVEDGVVSVRCEVSFILSDAKQNAIRGEIRGAASSAEQRAQERQIQNLNLAGQALRGAVRSALGNSKQAFVVASRN